MPSLSRWRKAALAALVALVGGAGVYQYGPASQLLPPTNVTVNAPAAGGYTDAEGALWVVASGGAASGSCPVGTPCTLAYALSSVAANGTIILNSGTYTGTWSITNTAGHDNLTITATAAVKNATTFNTYGVVSGTDDRPYFAGATDGTIIAVAESGVTLSWIKVRGNTTGWDDAGPSGVISVTNYPFTLDHSEVYNGGILVMMRVNREMTITNSHFHNTGSQTSWPFVGRTYSNGQDTHGLQVTNYSNSPQATTYANGILIQNNTIHDIAGNAIQENSWCYSSGTPHTQYVTINHNELYNSFKQNWDSKGTSYVIFSNNVSWYGDHTGNDEADYGHIAVNQPNDCSTVQMNDWEIYNNVFYGSIRYVNMWNKNGSGPCLRHHTYNNLMYGNNLSVAYADDPVYKLCGDAGSTFYHNVMVDNVGDTQSGGLETCGSGDNVKNNIFMNNGADGDISSHAYNCTHSGTPDHNYYLSTDPVGAGRGTNAITTCYTSGNCAGFVSHAGRNFRLIGPTSPNYQAGTSVLSSPYNVDILGITRTGTVDLGAYVYQ